MSEDSLESRVGTKPRVYKDTRSSLERVFGRKVEKVSLDQDFELETHYKTQFLSSIRIKLR